MRDACCSLTLYFESLLENQEEVQTNWRYTARPKPKPSPKNHSSHYHSQNPNSNQHSPLRSPSLLSSPCFHRGKTNPESQIVSSVRATPTIRCPWVALGLVACELVFGFRCCVGTHQHAASFCRVFEHFERQCGVAPLRGIILR